MYVFNVNVVHVVCFVPSTQAQIIAKYANCNSEIGLLMEVRMVEIEKLIGILCFQIFVSPSFSTLRKKKI